MTRIGAISVFLFYCATTLAADTAELKALFPAGGQRGKTTEVRAIGEFPRWPLSVWASSTAIQVEADSKQNGVLRVAVGEDARPGVHWLRLYDSQGASRTRPFIVETCPEVLENEGQDEAQRVDLTRACIVNGRLPRSGEVDQYIVPLKQGQTLVAAVTAHRHLGSPMDAVMQLVDAQHHVVLRQNDDAPGLDPRIRFVAERDSDYIVRLFAFPETPTQRIGFAGGDNFVYRLALSVGGVIDRAYPLAVSQPQSRQVAVEGWNLTATAPQRALAQASRGSAVTLSDVGTPGWGQTRLVLRDCLWEQDDTSRTNPLELALPMVVSGRIQQASDEDEYGFLANKDDTLRFTIESRSLGFPLDPVLVVLDETGKELVSKDDDGGGRDCSLDFKVPADGRYRLVVRDLHGNGGEDYLYRLAMCHVTPSFELELRSEVFRGNVGGDLEIPVKIVRRDGFKGDIHVTAVGLPASVFIAPAIFTVADGNKSEEQKIVVRASAAVSGPFRVIGVSDASSQHVPGQLPSTVPAVRTGELWLTAVEPTTSSDTEAE